VKAWVFFRGLEFLIVAQNHLITAGKPMTGKTYETDFYGWTNEQAALLRAGKLSAADIANIADEIESMRID
jgi:hypothetical protein